jgi:acyl-CoA synthetase (AMP-forming)/AMP-acid ligase II
MSIVVHERGAAPFDMSGIERDSAGILRYVDRPASVVAMLEHAVEANPEAEALVEVGGRRMTYRELWERSRRVAGGLRDRGVAPGDRVALRAPNGIDWVLAFFGTLMAGAVVVP